MKRILSFILGTVLFAGCIPSGYDAAVAASDTLSLYPDYTDLVIPCNIAPMNFIVRNEADACVVVLSGGGREIKVKGPEVAVPVKQWHELLEASKVGS